MRARVHHPRAGPARAGVAGIDISASLISKARETEQDEPRGIRYIHADVTAPGALGEGEFDAADPRMEGDHEG